MAQGREVSIWRLVGTHLLLVVFTLLTLYPILWVVDMALTPGQAFAMDPIPWPSDPSLEHFRAVIGTETADGRWLFGRQLLNSLIVAGVTSLLGISLAATAGYAMSRWAFPGRDVGMALFLITQMFPGVVMAVPLYILLDELSMLDSMLGLALVYATTSVPFCTWNLKGYFDTLPVDLEEAALMDGASRWTTFWRILLPLSKPALVVTGLFSFMTAWNEFILAATFLGKEERFTLPVVLNGYVGDFGTDWGSFAAAAILVSLPVLALFFALQRQLVEGLTAGSVKG
ncbi:MAG: sugar ABC transporter permease [Myxococcota bacterium]|nr:sugar ABC transporter permease [Myxococcota bacterium]